MMTHPQRRAPAWKRLRRAAAAAFVLSLVAWAPVLVIQAADEQAAPTFRATRTARSTPGGSESDIAERLNEILENQQRILSRLDEVMKELQVVKLRATQR